MERHEHHHHEAHAGAHGGGASPGRHDRHAGHSVTMFRDRFWVSLALTVPILAYSPSLWAWASLEPPSLPGATLVPFMLASLIYGYGGAVFVRSAIGELRTRLPGMMTLVAVGITTAYVYSVATTFVLEGEGFYWELATLVDIMLLGHWIEMRSIAKARGALDELAKLLPDTAERLRDGSSEEVPVSAIAPGDLVLVRPGARVPADGEVIDGSSAVNESMLTGESRPVHKRVGDTVIAGAVNGDGALRVRVTRTGADTALAGIARLVAEAEASKSRAQAIADRAAMILTYVAIVAGSTTALVWALVGPSEGTAYVVERAVTVVVIACPHALGLAVPLVISISTSLAARGGLLVRDRLALERARDLDVVVFDKTGTLTRGDLGVVGIATVGSVTEDDALRIAATLEQDSEHPLGRAIVNEARRRGITTARAGSFRTLAGRGVEGEVDGSAVMIGGPQLLASAGADVPADLDERTAPWAAEGKAIIHLLVDGSVAAAFAIADAIRDESRDAVERLRAMGIRVAMITGDSDDVARWVARELAIDEHFSQVLPEHKAARVEELQRRGLRVAMVGDGVNDAPALAQADVGVAIGAGTDVAIEAAHVILTHDDPRDVVRVVRLSRASYRKMVQNLVWATGYNVFAIPLAAGVLAPLGIVLAPAVGALLMSASTVVVAANAQLLRRERAIARDDER